MLTSPTSSLPTFSNAISFDGEDIRIGNTEVDQRIAAELTGAPDGAGVIAEQQGDTVTLTLRHPEWIEGTVEFNIALAGDQLVMGIDQLRVKQPGQGLGSQMLFRISRTAEHLGIARIDITASSGPDAQSRSRNGVYTWVRFGFDHLGEDVAELHGAREQVCFTPGTLLDLMHNPTCRECLKSYQGSLKMTFDLATGSRSWTVLRAYLHEKHILRESPGIP